MADEQGAIPEGMKAWAGGDAAPADWDGGPVFLRRGELWTQIQPLVWGRPYAGRGAEYESGDIIAYTPATLPPQAPAADRSGEGRFWLIVHEPGNVPDRKGSWPRSQLPQIMREFIDARPNAYLTVLTVGADGTPDVQHGPEALQMADGRSMSVGSKHNARTKAAHSAVLATPKPATTPLTATSIGDSDAVGGCRQTAGALRAVPDGCTLTERQIDADCGCPEEMWDTPWGELHMHLSAGKPSNACLDNGDEGEREMSLTTATIAEARAAIFGWAAIRNLPDAGEPL